MVGNAMVFCAQAVTFLLCLSAMGLMLGPFPRLARSATAWCIVARMLLALIVPSAQANTRYWDGGSTNLSGNGDSTSSGGDGTWNTTNQNWDAGAVPHTNWVNANNDTATFGGTAGVVTNQGVTVGGLTFTTANYVLINSTVTFGVAGTISNAVDAAIASGLAGTGPITKTGVGTLTLSGTNTYSGGTVVGGGTLAFVGVAAQPASSTLAISNGATVRLSTSVDANWPVTTVTGAGTLVADTTGGRAHTLTSYAMSGFSGVLDITAAGSGKAAFNPPFALNTGATLRVENGATAYYGWSGITLVCNVELNGAGNTEGLGALRLDSSARQNGPVLLKANSYIGCYSGVGYIGGVISDGGLGYGFTKVANYTIVLQATNTYTGPTVIQAGTLQCDNAAALGNGGALSIANGAVLNLNYSGNHNISALTLGGTLMSYGIFGSTNSPATYQDSHFSGTGTVTVAFTATNANMRWWDGGSTNIPGSGNGASTGGSGTWNNTIQNWDAGGVPHTNWVSASNSTAVFAGTGGVVTNQGVTVGGLMFMSANYVLTNSTVTFGVAGTILSFADATIASVLAGTVPITKTGAGALRLSGTNTYSGPTTVSAGTLTVAATGQLGTNNLTIAAGATVVLQQGSAISRNACVDIRGILNLSAGVTNAVRRLYFNGVCQNTGVWNTARDATHFSGAGSLIVTEFPYGKMIPLRSPTYRGYDFCGSLTGSALKSGQPYELLYDTGSWDICIPYGSLNKSNLTVLQTDVNDCWGVRSDMVQGQLSMMSADGTTNYTIDNFIFFARKNADGSDAPDDRGQASGNSIMGAFPSIWPQNGRPSLPFLLAQKYSATNAVGLGMVSETLQDFYQDWRHAKSYLQLGMDPQLTSNLNWRSDMPLWTLTGTYTNYCPYRVPGFGITFGFTSNVPDLVVTGLNATVDCGAPELCMKIASNDPQRNAYAAFFTDDGPAWRSGTYKTSSRCLGGGQTVQVQFTGDTGKSTYYRFPASDQFSSMPAPAVVIIGEWTSSVPWAVSADTPKSRISLGNSIYFFCPVYFWDVSHNRVGVSDFVNNSEPWGVSLDNAPATAITTNSAALNATLSCSGTNFDIYAYWNTVNGGTDPTLWTNSVYVGSWTNVLATNISCTLSTLTTNTTYYFRFLATNTADSLWASTVLNFTTLPLPPVIIGQPASITNMAGSTATFTVTASGATSYQWYKDGVPLVNGGTIAGVGTPVLTVSSVGMSEAGSYSVVVANANTNVTSVAASLTVIPLATLTWDANGTGAGVMDGAGTWSNTSNTWWNGTTNVSWANDNDAWIGSGGSGGIITLTTGPTAHVVTFTNFSGTYTLSNNTLTVVSNLTVAASASNVLVKSGISGTGTVRMNGSGTITLAGTNTYSGGTVVSSGTLAMVGAAAQPAGSTLAISSGASVRISASADSTWPATTVTGAGMLVADTASGRSLTLTSYDLSGFTGVLDVTASGGNCKVGFNPPFTLNNGATLKIENGTTAYYGWLGLSQGCNVELWGAGNAEGLGALRLEGSARQNGPVLLKANSYIGGSSGLGYIGGVISDGGLGYGFTKVSGATLVLQATNTYTGPTIVQSGTLQCDNAAALGNGGALSINNGAVLNLNYSGTHVIPTLTLGGTNMPLGVYGSASSSATFQDAHFSGTGTVTVAPGTCMLTVSSLYGNPSPSGVTNPQSNSLINAVMMSSFVTNGSTQYVCKGWVGVGSLTSGSGTNASFTITNDTTLTWQWQTNYWLHFDVTGN